MSKMKNIWWNKAKQKSNTPKGEKVTINILVYTLLDFTQANRYIFQN